MLEYQPPRGQENCSRDDKGAHAIGGGGWVPSAVLRMGIGALAGSAGVCTTAEARSLADGTTLADSAALSRLWLLPGCAVRLRCAMRSALLASGLLAFARVGGSFSAYPFELGGAPGLAFGVFGLLAFGLLGALASGLGGALAFGLGAAFGFCLAFGLDGPQALGLGGKAAVGLCGALAFGLGG